MNRKEIEEKLQQEANKIEMPSFESIWEKIEPRIKEIDEQKEKEKPKKRNLLRPLAVTFACLVVTCLIILPFALQKPNEKPNDNEIIYYLNDDLIRTPVNTSEFLLSVQGSSIKAVDLSKFKIETSSIYKTDTGIVKGGELAFLDSEETPTCMIDLKFYDNDVQVTDTNENIYDTNYTTQSGATIEYKYDNELDKFYIKAEYKTVQYFMEYTGVNETVTQFFETFFE